MANICGASICGDVLKINEVKYQIVLWNFYSKLRPFISVISFLSLTLPHTAEASIPLVSCNTSGTIISSLQKYVTNTLPVMLLCTFTYHIQYSLDDAPLPAVTVHEWQ